MEDKIMATPLTKPLSRRAALRAARAGAFAFTGTTLAPALATGTTATPSVGSPRIRLDLPSVYKDGSSVPLSVEVDNAMTEADQVSQVRVLAPDNPLPEVARFRFTPLSGRAMAATRIRLEAGVQPILVAAELSDGSTLTAQTSVRVLVGGCNS